MQFIVIEDFTGCDRKEIYRRFRERGRLKPDEIDRAPLLDRGGYEPLLPAGGGR